MTQADALQKAVGSFGAAAKAKLNQGGQPEDQLRAPLETLFAALAAETAAAGAMTMIGEASLADLRTRPDYAVQINKALIGFVEVKAPGKGYDPRKFKDKHHPSRHPQVRAPHRSHHPYQYGRRRVLDFQARHEGRLPVLRRTASASLSGRVRVPL